MPPEQHARDAAGGRRPAEGRVGGRAVLLVLALVVLAAAACSQVGTRSVPIPQPAQSALPSAPASPASQQALAGRGRLLFGASCAGCHGQSGQGTQLGPSLVGVGAASADFQLSTGRMPLKQEQSEPVSGPPAFPRPDIDALVAYVASLGQGPGIPTVGQGDLQRGRALYLENCAACHGSTVVGSALPDGHVAPSLRNTPPTQVAEAIRVGPGLMPVFPPTALSSSDVDSIVAYVGEVPRVDSRGGWPIGTIGPLPEGIVAWLLGLGVLVVVVRLLGKRARR